MLLALLPQMASAAPALRYQVDQRGDFILFGNTLSQECRPGTPAPLTGTVGACGSNTSDQASDVHWTTDGLTAFADTSVTPADSRSQAVLTLPAGAVVTYARLYWGAVRSVQSRTGTMQPGTSVTLSRVGAGAFATPITADSSKGYAAGSNYAYQSTADVTALVQQRGPGTYLLAGADALDFRNVNDTLPYSGWSMVVFYRLASEPLRNLTLFDGLDPVASGAPATATLSGFLVPASGYSAKLGVIAYEGEASITGDALNFNGAALSDAQNPANNFFNGTRSRLGVAQSNEGDLPRFTGTPGTIEGLDMDVVDITSRISAGQTSATVSASSTQDVYLLGAFITSISTQKPDFIQTVKSVAAVSPRPDGSLRGGDVLEYTVQTTNTGDDSGILTVLTDNLPSNVTYVPGSLRVTTGANAGAKTDATGDDQGDYDPANRRLTVRLGTGANATQGGVININESTTVVFRVTINVGASGSIDNQAIVRSTGQQGAPETTFPSSPPVGTGPTTTPVGGPAAPAVTAPTVGSTLATRTPTFSGTAEAGSTVTVREGTTVLCTATANASGNWSCTSAVQLPDGAHTVTAQAADANGNLSPTTSVGFNVDTTAPVAPVISTPAQNAQLNTATPTFTGTAEAGSTVTVREGTTVLCTTTANAVTGAWSCASSVTLGSGSHTVTATARDAVGNTGPASAGRTFVVDVTAPTAPVIVAPANGAAVSSTTPTFSGFAEAGSMVSVVVGGVTVCTATANASGAWSCVSTTTLPQGTQTATVTATDAAGNTGPASTTTFSVDTVAPAAPVVTAPTANQAVTTKTPVLSGTAEANSTVTVREGTTILCTTTANSSGAWSCTSSTLAEGAHTITATARDAAGNTGPASTAVPFSVDSVAPAAPVVTAPTANQTVATSTPVLSGTAEANSTVTVREGTTVLCTATANASGVWSCTSSTLSEGAHSVTATARDAAGNTGPASTSVPFTVDSVAPAAPVITAPTANQLVASKTPTLSGTAEANSTVTVREGTTVLCTTTTNASGAWSCTSSTLAEGPHSITATAQDAAGNTGPASTAVPFSVDTTAPAAPAITAPTANQLVATKTPVLSGTAEANSTVTVREGTTVLCTATANASGAWSCTSSTLTDGAHTVTATARDAAGNTGPASTAVLFTVDSTAPVAPIIAAPTAGQTVATQTPVLSGTAEANSTVTVREGTTVLCTAAANASGAWSCTSSTLAQGSHTIAATAQDAAGNVSPASTSVPFSVDTVAPVAPVIAAPTANQLVATRTPVLSGTAEANSTVTVREGTTILCTTTANASGAWSCTSSTLADGSHTITATARDAAGNTGPASTAVPFSVDATAPAAPIVTAPTSGQTLTTQTPVLSGTAEANSTVTVREGTTVLCTATTNASGVWSCTSSTLSEGSHTVTATARDAAGNTGPASTAVPFTVDTVAPVAPVIASPTANQSVGTQTPVLSGTAEANSTVTVREGTTILCTATTNASGAWSCTSSTLAQGAHTITATARDAAGNTGPASTAVPFTVDTVAPVAPVVTAPTSGQTVTTQTPVLSGTAEANSTVTVREGTTILCTTTANASGAWSCTSATLSEGSHSITATARDAAGNTGPASTAVPFSVDSIAPVAPVIASPTSGQVVATQTPVLSGTAEANSTVTVREGTTILCTATANASGAWSCTSSTLAEGPHTISAMARDAAGNTGPASTSVPFTVDSIDPVAPAITAPTANQAVATQTPVLSGTAEANSTVTVREGTTILCTATTNASGAWSCTSSTLSDGPHTITATARDAAGNTSPASTAVPFSVDTTAPAIPVVTAPTSGQQVATSTPVITGTAEANSTVTVREGTTVLCTTTADSDGAWSCTSSTLTDGPHTISVTARDAVGNTSPARTVSFTVDATVPDAPVIATPANGSVLPAAPTTYSGTAEPGSRVTVTVDGTPLGTVTANNSGEWSVSPGPALADGGHTVTAVAQDGAGNNSPVATSTFSVDTTAPDAPVFTSPAPNATVTTALPTLTGTADLGSQVTLVIGGTSYGPLTVDGTGHWSFTPATDLPQGPVTVTATATDSAGNVSDASQLTFIVDSESSDTVITSQPPVASNSPSATFTFRGTDADVAGFVCTLDTTSVACASPYTATGLDEGSHTFTVAAVDSAGNVDPTPASYTWAVDLTPPDAPIVLQPTSGEVLTSASPVITGTAEPNSTVYLVLDNGAPLGPVLVNSQGQWSYPVQATLADGTHTLSATATDAAGNTTEPVSLSFIIDTDAPDTTIESGPAQPSNSASATFEFSSTGGGITYECSVDSLEFNACDTPFTIDNLSEGEHTLAVRAVDAAGNADPTPAEYTWTVDLSLPEAPAITSPANGALFNTGAVSYAGTAEAGATVRVTVDGVFVGAAVASDTGAWTFTTGPVLDTGAHTVSVIAVDAAGNVSPSTSAAFSVDLVAPDTSLTASVPAVTSNRDASFEFTSNDSTATFECRFDTGTFVPCTSPQARTDLADGTYTVQVRAVDAAGNVDPTPATFTWTVDTTAPDTFIRSGPVADNAPNPATFDLDSNETGVTYACSLDDGPFSSCADPTIFTVTAGAHTLAVRATDAAGNVDESPATWSWTATHDADNDGLSDAEEAQYGTDPRNADTDGDGLSDGVEVHSGRTDPLDDDSDDDGVLDGNEDANHDGITQDTETDPTLADSDSDGLSDGVELGLTAPQGTGTDPALFVADADPATTTDPLNVDTDNGGVWDGFEDKNHNGKVDPGETNPLNAADDVDADGDGVDNATELELGLDPFNPDSDGDGLPDGIDGLVDTDGDGKIDALDTDSDNDGLTDGEEDVNHDGITQDTETDRRKADTDSDGLLDGIEVHGQNPTHPLASDTDGDGLSDGEEDTNANGIRDANESDPNKADTDGGGVSDGIEVKGGTNPLDADDDFQVLGRGCSTGGAGGLLPLALGLLSVPFLGRRRRFGATGRGLAVTVAAGLSLGVASNAQAQASVSQAIDVQQYKPGPGAYDVLGLNSARVAPHLTWNVGASLNYAHQPLNFYDPREDTFVYRIVERQVSLDLMGAVSLFDRLEVGLVLPLTVTGSQPAGAVSEQFVDGVGTAGLGDLRVVPKLALLNKGALTLAVVAPFTLPTGGGDHFLGAEGLTFQPRVAGEWATPSLRLLANVGVNLRKAQDLRNLRVGNELAFGVGAEVPITQALSAQATIAGAVGLSESDKEEFPLELLGAVKYRFAQGFAAHVGAGPGLTRGYGTPAFRVLAGLAYTPGGAPAPVAAARAPACALGPEDFDGFQDDDGCLDPDDDNDGIPDVNDTCPTEPETVNGYRDDDGCPDTVPEAKPESRPDSEGASPPAALALPPAPADSDGDGIPDAEDRCPTAAEDKDGFEDEDGCPDPDNDRDGIPDTADQCPLEAEVINGVKDEDGCPDKGASKVRLEGSRIVILDKVYFATGKDVILDKSFPLLAQVASILRAHPELELVRVEGHTDSQGDDAKNLDLSQRRANTVVAWLKKAGIDAKRLEPVGYGETKPVDTNDTAKGRENNRRVEFNVLKTAGQAEGVSP
ncbi:Ig-like domain-containing protein [Corallococcus sp. M7]